MLDFVIVDRHGGRGLSGGLVRLKVNCFLFPAVTPAAFHGKVNSRYESPVFQTPSLGHKVSQVNFQRLAQSFALLTLMEINYGLASECFEKSISLYFCGNLHPIITVVLSGSNMKAN